MCHYTYMLCVYTFILSLASLSDCVNIDYIDCGIDRESEVTVGDVEITQYPWVGVLYYTYRADGIHTRAVTTVVLVQKEFVIASAADIGPMPKTNFRRNSRVLLGEGWSGSGRRVRNYVIHPEYGETLNTVALVQLVDIVRDLGIRAVCPPPAILRNPIFYVIKFKEDFQELKKEVLQVTHVPGNLCKDFYVAAQLYSPRMRPPHATCAVSLDTDSPCVWNAGAALVARDHWGRWMLLGVGARGPGCGAPSRYLDMASYYPWVASSLQKFQQVTISKISKQKYVLRGSQIAFQRFGACDEEEKVTLVYRESTLLVTNNNQFQFLIYNLTIKQNIEYSCMTLELKNASAVSEMRIYHVCPRALYRKPCYRFKSSTLDLSVSIMFSDKCIFNMALYGEVRDLRPLDIHEWKWEEGTYYEDFTSSRVEYRGPADQTGYGFEPADPALWAPEFDVWTTTAPSTVRTRPTTTPRTTTTTTSTTTPPSTPRHTRKYWSRKTTPYVPTTTSSRPTTTKKRK